MSGATHLHRAAEATARLERELDSLATAADLAALLHALRAAVDARQIALSSLAEAAEDPAPEHLAGLESLAARGQAAITRLAAERDRTVRELATARQLLQGLSAQAGAARQVDCSG